MTKESLWKTVERNPQAAALVLPGAAVSRYAGKAGRGGGKVALEKPSLARAEYWGNFSRIARPAGLNGSRRGFSRHTASRFSESSR